MIQALVSLKSLIKQKSYHIDFTLFRLHYQATVGLLLGFCLILTAKILFGDTIDCISRSYPSGKFPDNLCYTVGTYTDYDLHSQDDPKYYFSGIALPTEDEDFNSTRYWHRYYQYIPLILFIQAVLFYFPHYLWKTWENGIISSVSKQLHDHRLDVTKFNDLVLNYLVKCFSIHKSLVYKYYICHLLLCFNLVAQIFILNYIFNNQFVTYGLDVLVYTFFNRQLYGLKGVNDDESLNDPMNFVFPKVTKCTLEMQSSAGGHLDTYQFLCVLPLNILHDKFFLIVWFWFVVLIIVTALQTLSDVIYLTVPTYRKFLFNRKYGKCHNSSNSLAELFMLSLIGSNSDKIAFTALLDKLNWEDIYKDRNGQTLV